MYKNLYKRAGGGHTTIYTEQPTHPHQETSCKTPAARQAQRGFTARRNLTRQHETRKPRPNTPTQTYKPQKKPGKLLNKEETKMPNPKKLKLNKGAAVKRRDQTNTKQGLLD